MKNLIFRLFSIIALLNQFFGVFIILFLIGLLTKTWIVVTLIGLLYLGIDLWRHKDLTKRGYKLRLGGYEK